VFSLLEERVRLTLWRLAAEFAYMALVDTRIVPPHSLLRRRVSRVVEPEFLSLLALRVGGDNADVALNSVLGVRLGGVPRCELLEGVMPELYKLCMALRSRGDEPLYKALPDVVVPLAVASSAGGFEEGDLLLAAYRAAAFGRGPELERVLRYFSRWYVVARF